jgi:hypothetical protein
MLLVTSNLPDKCPEAGHPTSRRIKNAKRIPPRLGLGATYRVYFREGLEINVIGISYRFSCRQHTYEIPISRHLAPSRFLVPGSISIFYDL